MLRPHILAALAVTLLSSALLAGCASMTAGCRQGEQVCPAYSKPNDVINNGTSCAVVILNDHVCTYDGEGRFKGQSIRPGTGGCICLGF